MRGRGRTCLFHSLDFHSRCSIGLLRSHVDLFSRVRLVLGSFSIIATTKMPESDQNIPGLFVTRLGSSRKG